MKGIKYYSDHQIKKYNLFYPKHLTGIIFYTYICLMTTEQIHKVVYLNGLFVGIDCIEHRDMRAGRRDENGVGYDELRYKAGMKSKSRKVATNYETVMIK